MELKFHANCLHCAKYLLRRAFAFNEKPYLLWKIRKYIKMPSANIQINKLRYNLFTYLANPADYTLMIFFHSFSQVTGIEISCKLSPLETMCMKCQNLFPWKNKKNTSTCHQLKILFTNQWHLLIIAPDMTITMAIIQDQVCYFYIKTYHAGLLIGIISMKQFQRVLTR